MERISRLLPKILIFVLSIILASCSAKKDAAEFATALETAIRNNDISTQRELCPFLGEGEALHFSFNPDSLDATVKDGLIIAQYGKSVRIDIRKGDDGKLSAERSYGLLTYPAEYKELAEATGQLKPDSDDVQNALRMRDRSFQQYLHFSYIPENVCPLTLGKAITGHVPQYAMDSGDVRYPVTNKSDVSVSADEYCFKYTSIYMGMAGDARSTESKPGINIRARGVEYITMYYSEHDFFDNLRIVFNSDDLSMLRKYAYETEGIYDKFELQYGAVSESPIQDGISGAYTCKGKIGPSIINGKVIVDSERNTFTGEYGYSGRSSGINLKGTIRTNGKFTAYEENPANGIICGYYLGSISNNVLSGIYQNFKGVKYQFSINLTK